MGYGVVGDRKYGDERINRIFREKYGLNNQFLFALSVAFEEEGGPLGYLYGRRFTADLPDIFEAIKRDYFGSFDLDVDGRDFDEGSNIGGRICNKALPVNKKYSESPFAD